MFSLNGSLFSGKNSLGIGSVGGLGASPKGSAASCPSGMVEYGSPSMCGSAADYEAYIQAQVAGAFGGSKEAAKSYLQTTQYGVEQNYGCDPPNVPTTDITGKKMCLHPEEARQMGLITSCPKGTTTDPKTGACVKNITSGKTSSGSGGSTVPVVKPTTPTTPVEPPPESAGINPMAIGAVALLLGAVGLVVYKKRKKSQGYSANEYED